MHRHLFRFSSLLPSLGVQKKPYLRDWLIQVLYTAWRQFMNNELQNHAAATAFYFLLSAAPMALLVSYASQVLAHIAETSNLAVILLAAFYDQFHLDRLMAAGFIPDSVRVSAGGVGLLTLILSSRGLVNAVHSAFRVIFPDGARRRLVASWLLPLVIIPAVFSLVVLAFLAQGALTFLAEFDLLGGYRSTLLKSASTLLSLAAIWGLVFAAYWRLPLRSPGIRPAMLLAGLCTLTLAALFTGFDRFFHIEQYRNLYGALGGVVFILIGSYFACLAFYFWAQCLHALTKVDVAALENLVLGSRANGNRLDALVFGRADRLLAKFGHRFAAGDALIREGDDGQEAFYLYSGQVELFKSTTGGPHKLGEMETGELFGEMAYLLKEKRSASVIAKTETVALVLPPTMLEELMRFSAPLSRRIVATLSQRLRRMNQASAG
ncbi:MAG: cyclic nucleotide-binding protein [Hydrogenophilales bacterium CG03_land_8_20_14_0_80_62_28]|nr:cyclic nucleotide-binding domain-containing protein [Betaproteobacteria bacterium]PIV23709.1 MAG: cyclic nucleotide-binding protein [Hydrogenophilales bacterium CG03_land_8_20_14_0_80_62_28]